MLESGKIDGALPPVARRDRLSPGVQLSRSPGATTAPLSHSERGDRDCLALQHGSEAPSAIEMKVQKQTHRERRERWSRGLAKDLDLDDPVDFRKVQKQIHVECNSIAEFIKRSQIPQANAGVWEYRGAPHAGREARPSRRAGRKTEERPARRPPSLAEKSERRDEESRM